MENNQRSFVENVNIVANATTLATGDVIEDASLARDEAVAAAENALNSEIDAANSEALSQKWAENAYNNEVTPGKFSSFHWAETARLSTSDPIINDLVISSNYTWSSYKMAGSLSEKANEVHTHAEYEPLITKNTAFNRRFSGSGLTDDVARADHTHSGYEPAITNKGTAFNKDFGTQSGTVAEGPHSHPYEPEFGKLSAFNKNFVVDQANPLADEVPRGTHTHLAETVVYDPSGNSLITSATVQGGMTQLDAKIGTLNIYERSSLTAGMSLTSDVIGIGGVGTPTKIITGMNVGTSTKNAIYSNGAIKIDYPSAPTKLIEGWYTFGLTIDREANTEYTVYMYRNGVVIDTSYTVKIGGTSTSAGLNNVSLDAFLAALENDDELSVYVSNDTNTNPVTISGFTVSFAGAPEGAVILSGTSIDHSDITGTGAANGVHTISDIKDLEVTLTSKAEKAIPAVIGNFAALDVEGNLIDSGVESSIISTAMQLVNPAVLDNIVVQTTEGDSKDGGLKITDLALVGGSPTTTFEVDTATADTHAVTKIQLDTLETQSAKQVDLDTHVNDITNAHQVTYTQVGAAPTVHTHSIADTSLLQDALDNKYSKVATPATDNFVAFDTGGLFKDSGVAYTQIGTIQTAVDLNTAKVGVTTEVKSDTTETGAVQITNMVSLTQAAYDALTPVSTTFYIIVE